MVVEPQYDWAESFYKGWGRVVRGDQSFFSNQEGELSDSPIRPHPQATATDPDADLFDGFGNGSLHLYLVRDLKNWRGEDREDAFYLEMDFHASDWQAVFKDVLQVPEGDDYKEGDNVGELHERNRAKFQRSILEYPMLARIFDMYEDCEYSPAEVKRLWEESLKLKGSLSHPEAVRALRKLIYACDEASERGFSLVFICD